MRLRREDRTPHHTKMATDILQKTTILKNGQVSFANICVSTHQANAVKYEASCTKISSKAELAARQRPQNHQISNGKT